MKLQAARETILAPLQSVISVVERRQTMPILANVLLSAHDSPYCVKSQIAQAAARS
jgi:DNA polymerase-3 subunit beta